MSVCPACLTSLSLGQDVDAENICTLTASVQLAGCKEGCTREECLKGPSWRLGRQAGVPKQTQESRLHILWLCISSRSQHICCSCRIARSAGQRTDSLCYAQLGLNNSSNSPHTVHITQAAAFSSLDVLKLSVICPSTSCLRTLRGECSTKGATCRCSLHAVQSI